MAIRGESVSKVCKRIGSFNAEECSERMARERGGTAASYVDEWAMAAETGTAMHSIIERMVLLYCEDPSLVRKRWKEEQATAAYEECGYYMLQWYTTGVNRVHTWMKGRKDLELVGVEMELTGDFELEDPVSGDIVIKEFHGITDAVFTFTQSYRGDDTTRHLLVDWKTARTLQSHAKHLFQVCLYALLYHKMTGIPYKDLRVCIIYTTRVGDTTAYYQKIHNPAKLRGMTRMYEYLGGLHDGTDAY